MRIRKAKRSAQVRCSLVEQFPAGTRHSPTQYLEIGCSEQRKYPELECWIVEVRCSVKGFLGSRPQWWVEIAHRKMMDRGRRQENKREAKQMKKHAYMQSRRKRDLGLLS